jgi:hypothetical protein
MRFQLVAMFVYSFMDDVTYVMDVEVTQIILIDS